MPAPSSAGSVAAVHGTVAPGFEPFEEVFRENFEQRGEIGASACAVLDGRVVVDLWGGFADREAGRAWEADTLGIVFSATKGLTALALLMLGDRGKLDWDAPVSTWWPEFARDGKDGISVRLLLNHRSGLCAIDEPLTLDDFAHPDRVARALEVQRPLWAPGSAQGYGAVSMGAYSGELFRRVEGRSLGRFLADEVAGPLGADVYLGLPEPENARCARLYPGSLLGRMVELGPEMLRGRTVDGRIMRAFLRRSSATRRALANPRPKSGGIGAFDTPRVRALELPWANAMASARGLARVYAALVAGGSLGGVPLCSADALRPLEEPQSWGMDRVLHKRMGFSQGFVKEEPEIFSPSPEAYGHPGMGGALGLADPARGLAFAYVPNRMDYRLRSPRCLALCHALYHCLDGAA